MRPALHESLRSPSRLALLRQVIVLPLDPPVCYGCGTFHRLSRRKQSSTSNASKAKDRPLAGGVSASILSYITGQFKKRRKQNFKFGKGLDFSKDNTQHVATGEQSSTNTKAIEQEADKRSGNKCQDAAAAGNLFNGSAEEVNERRRNRSVVQLELRSKKRYSGDDCEGEVEGTVLGPRIQKVVTISRKKTASDGLFRKIGRTIRRPQLASKYEISHQELALGHRKLVIEKEQTNVLDIVEREETMLEEGGTERAEEFMDLMHENDLRDCYVGSQWKNLLFWDRRIPHLHPLGTEYDHWNIYNDLTISSSNILSRFVKHESIIDWTTYLTSFERLQYESDVGSEPTKGPRLIDWPDYASDFELWLRLVQFRQRHHFARGLLPIWKKILARGLHLPTKGRVADLLWISFLDLGFADQKSLDEIISYAITLKDRTGNGWEMLYYRIMRHCLGNPDGDVYHRHSLLHRRFPPTRKQYLSLFRHTINRVPQSQMLLQQMYKDLLFRDLYSPMMQYLFETQNYRAATDWHEFLIAQKDLPEDVQEYRPLFREMVLYGDPARLAAMVHQMVEAKVPLPPFINDPTPMKPFTRELISQRLADTHGVVPKTLDDQFYARLFATKLFPVEAVIKVLPMLGADLIGPALLRELIVRVRCDLQTVQARIEQIREMGVSFSETIFCRLVLKLVETGNTALLESVATCDLHPDTFEDADLQESLLSNYDARGDQLQFDRSLAILMMHCPERYHKSHYWNIYLRLYLKRKDIPAVSRTLDMMQASRVKVDRKSSAYVRISLMSRRRKSVRPLSFDELPLIINIWQGILRSGGTMPATVWVEILKRLGMVGKLEEYEKLALWLAEWYSASPARAYLGGLFQAPVVVQARETATAPPQPGHFVHIPGHLQTHHPNHPLRVLFPKAAQQSVVAWGFQHARIGGPGWRWGLYMLLKLRRYNVHIERETVAKACKLRLRSLFGPGRSNRLINRRETARNAAQLAYYIQEMEKIAGSNLFQPVSMGGSMARKHRLPKDEAARWSVLAAMMREGRIDMRSPPPAELDLSSEELVLRGSDKP